MNVSKIAEFPNTLVKLYIDLNENPSASYFQHLTKLKKLVIHAKVDFEYHPILSRLQSLEQLWVEYVTPESQVLKITLEGCPVSLSFVGLEIEEGNVESFENKCPNVSEIDLINDDKPCDCGVFNQLKTGVGEYRKSLFFHLFAENLVERNPTY